MCHLKQLLKIVLEAVLKVTLKAKIEEAKVEEAKVKNYFKNTTVSDSSLPAGSCSR